MTDRLRRKDRKITGPRQAILDVLRQNRHPLTTKEVLRQLGESDCDLATIYRSLHLLENIGMVKRFDFGDGAARYELVGHDDHDHHHHLICMRCGKVVEIEECFPRKWEQEIAQRHGFSAVNHKLEFFGLCPRCQKARG